MKKMSDVELVRLALTQAKMIPYWLDDDTKNETELLSRLARGKKAIEAMENIGLCISVLNDFNVKYKMNDIIEIFGEYQQSKEVEG